MALFKYQAIDQKSQAHKSGLVEATNEKLAADALLDRGLEVLSLEKESSLSDLKIFSVLNRISAKELVIFSRQFSVLISANVTMVQSLKILTEQTKNVKLKMIISEVADEVDSGSRLSDSLAKWPDQFSNFYISVIRSGETSGKLDEVLNYLAEEMEKDYDMMSKIRGAMIYPAFVLSGLLGVGIAMMVFVVPKLTEILKGSGAELPFTTRLLMSTSDIMVHYWFIVIVFLVLFLAGFRYYSKTPGGRTTIDIIKLHLPIFGNLFQRIYLVRFTRSMNTLILGGVTIVESLKISADVVSNNTYRSIIMQTAKEVEDGNSLTTIFASSEVIPKMVSQMISVGEKTGRLDLILERITDFYSREIDNIVANLMTLMEPIIMIVMGVAVGFMVAAVIMPMYNLASSL